MGTYAFKALDLAGTSTRGELEADDKQAVAAQLRSKGLIVLDIEEKKSAADVGAMLEAGELGGILESTLQRVADQLEKDDSLRRQVKSAMMYPMMIGGFALTVLLALVTFLVPVFEKVFKDFGGSLPTITKVTVALSHFVTGQWYIGLLLTVGAVVGFRKWKRTEK